MIRTVLILTVAVAVAGCGREPDRPRFLPATGPGSTEPAQATGEVLGPRQIKMH